MSELLTDQEIDEQAAEIAHATGQKRASQEFKAEQLALRRQAADQKAFAEETQRLARNKVAVNNMKILREKDRELEAFRNGEHEMNGILALEIPPRGYEEILDDLHATQGFLGEMTELAFREARRYQNQLAHRDAKMLEWRNAKEGAAYNEQEQEKQRDLQGYASDKDVVIIPPIPKPVDKVLAERHRQLHYRLERLRKELVSHPQAGIASGEREGAMCFTITVNPTRAARGTKEDPLHANGIPTGFHLD